MTEIPAAHNQGNDMDLATWSWIFMVVYIGGMLGPRRHWTTSG
ncbi:MAG: hypothetical protein Ct9H300mP8_07940 [Gammaproteobacteria bacterium]|nr:MAG: hypothetical protein Ct9H300mP8_07940 [Gammaproteobacteria bacterium]